MYQAAKKRSKKRRRTGTAKAKMKIKAFPSRVQEVEHAGGSFQRQSLAKAQEKDDIDKLKGQEERQLSSRAKHLTAARSWVSNKFKFAFGEVCSSWKRRKNLFYASELPECATKSQKRIFNTGTSTLRAKKHEQSTSKRGSSKLRAEAIKQDSVGDMTETAGRLGGCKRKVNAQSKKNAWFTNAIKQRVNLGLRTTTDIQVLREELESVVSSFDIVKWGKILAYAAELLKRSSEYEELSDGQERAILQYFGSKLPDMPLFISREKVLAFLNEHKDMFPRVQYSIALQISIERYIIRRDCSAASNKRCSSLTLPSRQSQYGKCQPFEDFSKTILSLSLGYSALAVAKAKKQNSLTTASARQKPRGNKSELRGKSKGIQSVLYLPFSLNLEYRRKAHTISHKIEKR